MKIAVNCRFIIENKMEGIGYFSYEMTRRLAAAHPEHQFHLLFDRQPPDLDFGANTFTHVLFPPARHPLLWFWFFEWSVSRFLKKEKMELFLSHDGFVPLHSAVPSVAVQHDIAFEQYPEHVGFAARKYYQYFVPRFLRRAARVATVSEFSKQDMVRRYGVDAAKIDVVYNAPQPGFAPLPATEKDVVRRELTQGRPYFFYVGSINPRKNLVNMLRAFDVFKKKTNSEAMFVIAGAKGWQNSELESVWQQMQHRGDVKFIGRLQPIALQRAMAAAQAFLYVSMFEGFGVPPLEAMAAGVPVIASNVSSLPEVCGHAALLTDPHSVEQMAQAMRRITEVPEFSTNLVERGFAQAARFSLDRSAALLWESMQKLI